MIERDFDIGFIADLALREKQIQQNYRPIIAVHKWFARRPGTLFRGLLLAEFSSKPLRETFYKANNLKGLRIADPFMGGGTPLIEANRLGCDVLGLDINPMAYWIVTQEIEQLDLEEYASAACALRKGVEKQVGALYRTRCTYCGATDAHVKYFLWVKVLECSHCHDDIDLFPGYLLATDSRHPKNVFVCHACRQLSEKSDRERPGLCDHCGADLSSGHRARRNRCKCAKCDTANSFPNRDLGPPRHRLFAIEYFCPACRSHHKGRFFKCPDAEDQLRIDKAARRVSRMRLQYVPQDAIPPGDESDRLHRWGYTHYSQMFNARQLLALEVSARLIARVKNPPIHGALATNLSDLVRYQNMLCRYDTMALKSLDIFSVHGFPVGLVQCESNLVGVQNPRTETCIGSGGWANVIDKFRKAKSYCSKPFEVRYHQGRKYIVPTEGEWIGRVPNGTSDGVRIVDLRCSDAATIDVPTASFDAVFTDPPYFGNVQYAELMDFCYIWLRRLLKARVPGFCKPSTRHPQELTANDDMGRGVTHFTDGLSAVFRKMAHGLKAGAPLAFTYHHNDLTAYYPLAVAVLDAGLTCTASLPCPAEMSASIHINGTTSSIIDTVFVCRSTGALAAKWIVTRPDELAKIIRQDLSMLKTGNVRPTRGDIRCITFGHLIRLAIWSLRDKWDNNAETKDRLSKIGAWVSRFGDFAAVEECIGQDITVHLNAPLFEKHTRKESSGVEYADLSF